MYRKNSDKISKTNMNVKCGQLNWFSVSLKLMKWNSDRYWGCNGIPLKFSNVCSSFDIWSFNPRIVSGLFFLENGVCFYIKFRILQNIDKIWITNVFLTQLYSNRLSVFASRWLPLQIYESHFLSDLKNKRFQNKNVTLHSFFVCGCIYDSVSYPVVILCWLRSCKDLSLPLTHRKLRLYFAHNELSWRAVAQPLPNK